MAKNPDVQFKRMKEYGRTDGTTIFLDKRKFKGIEGLDTIIHERNHVQNMRASEESVIKKTTKQVNGYLSII